MTSPIAQSARLDPIALSTIARGGYTIRHRVDGVPVSRAYLCVGRDDNRFEVTGGYRKDQLPDLLAALRRLGKWGVNVDCWIQVEANGKPACKSAKAALPAPVAPLVGPMTFATVANAVPPLTYPGNGHGRTLTAEIAGAWWFRHGQKLETSNPMRGFDCTTFPMALFATYPDMSGKYGTALADALGATPCGMEQLSADAARTRFLFPTPMLGLYFMWSAGHVVLVKDAVIHEFTHGGYRRTPAQAWEGYRKAPQGLWWIRKLPAALQP